METAASVSSVGTSPQHAMTTSGAAPWSLLAHCQMPMPAVQCLTAGVHRQPLWGRVFARDNDIDVMSAAQAVVHDRQRQFASGGQVNPYDFGPLVDDMVDETGILVGEAVVILALDMRGKQVV